MEESSKNRPSLGAVLRKIKKSILRKKSFPGSEKYWIERYQSGKNSGAGSYNKLSEFKAEILNGFVKDHGVRTIIEFGSGDGNQLKLAQYPSYIGFDISPRAIQLCRGLFQGDSTKKFSMMSDYDGEKAQLTLSLDVIFHLVEDDVFHSYMERLFSASERSVIIYSSNYDEKQIKHVRSRQFTPWIEKNAPQWKITRHIPNRYPYQGSKDGSISDFFIFEKTT